MKRSNRTSVSLSDDELGIFDAIARHRNLSRSEVLSHLLLYHGLCGGEMPLTSKILALPERDRARVVSEIRKRAENDDPAKPQSFRKWVKDTLGNDDPATVENGAGSLLMDLLKETI